MNLEFIKPQNLGSFLMKSSQSNFNLRSPGSYLVRSYLITTVIIIYVKAFHTIKEGCNNYIFELNLMSVFFFLNLQYIKFYQYPIIVLYRK